MPELIEILIDDQPLQVPPGISVSAALAMRGGTTRRSVSAQPRQAFCGMGVCQECRVSIDGLAQQLGCQRTVASGMRIRTDNYTANGPEVFAPAAQSLSTQVLVVGAGPGGLAAAETAALAGAGVLLIDAAALPGGQIWRATGTEVPTPVKAQTARLQQLGVLQRYGLRVVAVLPGSKLLCEQHDGAALLICYQSLILACGARELVLPFPGWTLPGVFGVGGLQVLVKSGWPIRSQRVVVAGSGPLLLAAAASLRRAGAHIVSVVEAVSAVDLRRFGLSLLRQPARLWQAARLRAALWSTPYLCGRRISAAHGATRLEAVRLDNGDILSCDALAIGDGLLPNLELPRALGCVVDLVGGPGGSCAVQVDAQMLTSQAAVYAVGELTGIGGSRRAQIQGWIAGCAAVGKPESKRVWQRRLQQENAFSRRLALSFPVPAIPEPAADTLICRCEDVSWSALQAFPDWRSAKLATRIGMGACQGRVCGAMLKVLKGWPDPAQDQAAPQPCSLNPLRFNSLLAMASAGDGDQTSRSNQAASTPQVCSADHTAVDSTTPPSN